MGFRIPWAGFQSPGFHIPQANTSKIFVDSLTWGEYTLNIFQLLANADAEDIARLRREADLNFDSEGEIFWVLSRR